MLSTLIVLLVACDATPQPSSTTAASVVPTAAATASPFVPRPRSITPGEVADSIRFRTEFGIRADEDWIRNVADRIDTDWSTFAVPLTPAEVSELEQRISASDAVAQVASAYGAAHPEDWGGIYVESGNKGRVTVLFATNLEAHRAAIMQSLSPAANITFRQVRFTLARLEAEAQRLKGTDAWFLSIPAVLTGYGVDVTTNMVRIKVSSIDPNVADVIRKKFGWPEGFVAVESDGLGLRLMGEGRIRLTVVDRSGRPLKHVDCLPIADTSGRVIPPGAKTDERGTCLIDGLTATGYWVMVQRDTPGPGAEVLGYVRATVAANRTTEARMVTR